MKRTLIILIFLALTIGVKAQSNAYDGIHIGPKATKVADSYINRVNVDESDSTITFYDKNGKLLNPQFNSGGTGNLFDYAARKYLVDTALVTSTTLTLAATHAGQVVRFSHATYQEVTIPANTIPVGSIITFIKTGAGPVRVNVGANVVRKSVLDSCTMNTVNQTYQILFRTTNKVEYIGNWVD